MTLAGPIEQSFSQAGFVFSPALIGGHAARIGRASRFRLVRFMATRLHVFVVIVELVEPASRAELDALEHAGIEHAIAHKGGLPRGLQTGSAVLTVALVPQADAALREWAGSTRFRFATIAYPVLVDASSGVVDRPSRMRLGRIYRSYLSGLAAERVTAVAARG